MNKKKLIILVVVLAIIFIGVIFFIIYNKDSNKLKRYLKEEGYNCNSSICTKVDQNIQYQVNYKIGTYRYEDSEIVIDINNERTTVDVAKGATKVCTFNKSGVKNLTSFTEDDTSTNCLIYLEKVNREVESFKKILVKSGADIAKLSK